MSDNNIHANRVQYQANSAERARHDPGVQRERSEGIETQQKEDIAAAIVDSYSNAYTTVPPVPRSITHLAIALIDCGSAHACIAKEIQFRTLHKRGDRPWPHNNVLAAIRELELVITRLKTQVPPMEELYQNERSERSPILEGAASEAGI